MNVRITYYLEQALLISEFEGRWTDEEIEDVLRVEFADPRTVQTTKHLIDVRRGGNPIASPAGLRRRAVLVNDYLQTHPRGAEYKLALLVRSEVDYGLGRMYEVFAKEMGQTRVFRDRQEALDWLGVRVDDESGADKPPEG